MDACEKEQEGTDHYGTLPVEVYGVRADRPSRTADSQSFADHQQRNKLKRISHRTDRSSPSICQPNQICESPMRVFVRAPLCAERTRFVFQSCAVLSYTFQQATKNSAVVSWISHRSYMLCELAEWFGDHSGGQSLRPHGAIVWSVGEPACRSPSSASSDSRSFHST